MSKIYTNYEEYPRSNFPVSVDNWENMLDINAITAPIAAQYNNLIAANNFTGAAALLESNPDLKKTLFNAEKINQLMDGIKALQKFFKDEVETYVDELFSNTIGIDDDAEGDAQATNAYSIKKINELLGTMNNVLLITFPTANWAEEGELYTQTVEVQGITENDQPLLVRNVDDTSDAATLKSYNKAYSMLTNGVGITNNGSVTWKCYKKPTIDITVGLKGVNNG